MGLSQKNKIDPDDVAIWNWILLDTFQVNNGTKATDILWIQQDWVAWDHSKTNNHFELIISDNFSLLFDIYTRDYLVNQVNLVLGSSVGEILGVRTNKFFVNDRQWQFHLCLGALY